MFSPARIASLTLSTATRSARSVSGYTALAAACTRHTAWQSRAPAVVATSTRAYSSGRGGVRNFPITAIALILGGLTLTGAGLWQFYTSGVNAFPEDIRNDLRKALYYQNYGNDRDKAVGYYRSALNAAMQHPDLKVDGPEVTGIMIQLGTMFQDMGRTQEAIDVLVMSFEVLVHGRTMGTGNDSATSSEHVHGPRVMDGPTRLKTVGIAQKLGDLYHALKKDQQAERYYLWSVEQLMKNHEQIQARSPTHTSDEERLQNARDREAMRKQFSFDNLPSWMTKTDFGASLEALGGFYTSKGVYSNALPLYMRALSLIEPNSCHAAVLMCNISDAFAGLGNIEDATGWAERGLKVGSAQSGQECDEGCGVILYNLGMLHEMKGDVMKAQDYYKQSKQHGLKTGFNQCIVESNKALKRMKEANEGRQA
ncbi:hypothetical protein BGZ97_005611 [Linnemannia gamsii]|uniref:TPR-like protein n=1 Tax=Linnemannia gamsii TaxID=64522 RepID=A0A9P6UGB1_9FUNG|nr:hypothetical protein BGZ97_005611 [Linnemannia gamsii]